MPSNPTIKGDNTVLWGAAGVFSGTGVGHVTSGRKRSYAEKLEVAGEDGYTVAVLYFDHKKDLEFEMVVKTAAPTLAEGDAITICGVATAVVDEIEEMWAQKDVRKLRVKATKYAALVVS